MPAQNTPPAGGGPTAPASPWAELSGTQRAIVLALLRHGRLSRPQIMSLVGISPGSITKGQKCKYPLFLTHNICIYKRAIYIFVKFNLH